MRSVCFWHRSIFTLFLLVVDIVWVGGFFSNDFEYILQMLGFDTSMESLLAVGGRSGSFADLNNSDFGLSSKSFGGRDLFPAPGRF